MKRTLLFLSLLIGTVAGFGQGAITRVNTINDLIALRISSTNQFAAVVNNGTNIIEGFNGGRLFVWLQGSSLTADTNNIFASSTGASGRWVALHGSIIDSLQTRNSKTNRAVGINFPSAWQPTNTFSINQLGLITAADEGTYPFTIKHNTYTNALTIGADNIAAHIQSWGSRQLRINSAAGNNGVQINGSGGFLGVGQGNVAQAVLDVRATNAMISVGNQAFPTDWLNTTYHGVVMSGSSAVFGNSSGDTTLSGNYYVKNAGNQDTYIANGPAASVYLPLPDFQFRTAPVGVAGAAITWTVPVVFAGASAVANTIYASAGKVGLLTASPNSTLDVNGTANVTNLTRLVGGLRVGTEATFPAVGTTITDILTTNATLTFAQIATGASDVKTTALLGAGTNMIVLVTPYKDYTNGPVTALVTATNVVTVSAGNMSGGNVTPSGVFRIVVLRQ